MTATREDGLPFAARVGSDLGPWKRLDLFTEEEMFELINRRSAAIAAKRASLAKDIGSLRDRFGDTPEIRSFLARLAEA
jgi:hypothetical protein